MRMVKLLAAFTIFFACAAPAFAQEAQNVAPEDVKSEVGTAKPALPPLKAELTNVIPGRYALLVFTGADASQPLDQEAIEKKVQEEFEKADVEQFQFAIYDKGSKPGSGIRGLGELWKNKDTRTVPFKEIKQQEVPGTDVPSNIFGERLLGYTITAQELHDAYSDNEVVADDDFKGKPIIMKIKVPKVSKDFSDKPYIDVSLGQYSLHGVRIYFAKDDPNIRKIKRGSEIFVRGLPRGFVMESVMVDGEIVDISEDKPAEPAKPQKGSSRKRR